jgi:hypothetical protein
MLIPVISSPPLCIMPHPPAGFALVMAVYITFITILSIQINYIPFSQKSIINNDIIQVVNGGAEGGEKDQGRDLTDNRHFHLDL